jgi:hypothetical protein
LRGPGSRRRGGGRSHHNAGKDQWPQCHDPDCHGQFGFTNPVLIGQDGEIIAGHGRVEAAKLLGMESVPTVRLAHLNAAQRRAYTHREQFVSRGDKAVRAQSMRGRMAMLGLYVRQGAPWFAELRAELLSFPAGRHDDQVDALGLVGQLLDKISAGPRPKPPEATQRDGYRAAFEEMPDDSWKTM